VKTESSSSSIRVVLVGIALILGALVAILGLRNYVNGGNKPTPTLMVSAVAIIVSPPATSTATTTAADLPLTNTPKFSANKTSVPDNAATKKPSTNPPNPTRTAKAKPSPTLTPSPTSKPQIEPTFAVLSGTQYIIGGDQPTPVPTFEVASRTTNVLLLGSDVELEEGVGRTDSIIIVSINHDGPTASMVSLPRDMWVYIPGWTMNRINTALSRGARANYPGGAVAQLEDTILYNFGVPIHYYAQVDFEGFKDGVDAIGGIDVAVSCRLRDWRLKSPELDPELEENWEIFTLEPGIHYMDGDMALWYARSRRTTSDFDRGRRQQQVLRAMLNKGVDLNLLPQVPELWNTYRDSFKTDMDIGRMLQLAALAPEVRKNGVQHLYIVGDQLQPYQVPESGARVQLPVWEKAQDTFQRLFLPPALNQASRPPITVEIVNSTDNPDLALLAADNLAWYGFEPTISDEQIEIQEQTTIEYYAQNLKGSFDWLLSWIIDKPAYSIELVTDSTYDYNYQIVLGTEYSACRPQLFAPQIFLEQE
jgi:LCP family protein required for cell wall assembly